LSASEHKIIYKGIEPRSSKGKTMADDPPKVFQNEVLRPVTIGVASHLLEQGGVAPDIIRNILSHLKLH
jgi:hypothetical protein